MDPIEVGEIIVLSDEDEQEQEFEVLGKINLDGTEYVAVCLLEDIQLESDEEVDIFFLKVEENGELSSIESDEEFDKVAAAFDENMKDEEEA